MERDYEYLRVSWEPQGIYRDIRFHIYSDSIDNGEGHEHAGQIVYYEDYNRWQFEPDEDTILDIKDCTLLINILRDIEDNVI